jgi:serine/threonine protein phosphatase PrpC
VADLPILIAAATRPHPAEKVNGDAWTLEQTGDVYRLTVVDGLGHGQLAHDAAARALEVLRARPELDPTAALKLCHDALRGTRGAAVSIVKVDLAAGKVVFAGVGNVEARVLRDGREERPIAFRGIVGVALPSVRAFEYPLEGVRLVLLHSDGVSSRLRTEALAAVEPDALTGAVEALLAEWGRPTDDATIVALRLGD